MTIALAEGKTIKKQSEEKKEESSTLQLQRFLEKRGRGLNAGRRLVRVGKWLPLPRLVPGEEAL